MKCKRPWAGLTGSILAGSVASNKFNVLIYGIAFFYLSRLEKHGSSYWGLNYIQNDLNGNENWFDLSRVRVTECKITVNVWTKSTGNRCWFELARVRVIGSRLYLFICRLMALPFLPYQDIPHVFRGLQIEATTEPFSDLVQYIISVNWINGTEAPKDWSIYGEAMRANNDVEGWHNAPLMSEQTPSPGKAAVSKTPTVNVEPSVRVAQKTRTCSLKLPSRFAETLIWNVEHFVILLIFPYLVRTDYFCWFRRFSKIQVMHASLTKFFFSKKGRCYVMSAFYEFQFGTWRTD